jgi:hypothetical protein
MFMRWRSVAIIISVTALLVVAAGIFLLVYPEQTSTLVGTLTPPAEIVRIDPNADIEFQRPLEQPPAPIKAMYLTGWSGGSTATVNRALTLLTTTELNAVVLDVKDYTGMVSYKPDIAQVIEYDAYEQRIKKINALIKQFHDAGVYVIGRIAVFQDPQLVKARPEFALQSIKNAQPWADYKGIKWLDAAAPAVWDYNIAIAKDALARGFDEVNFDYIRFPTDGSVDDIAFPFYNSKIETRRQVMQRFFKHLREELPYAKISVDIFGETAVNARETSIGQYFEDPFLYVDAVAPMIYPSHFAAGVAGFENPAAHPYEIIRYAMDKGLARLKAFEHVLLTSTSTVLSGGQPPAFAQLRPWLQDFDLGAAYDAAKVRAQITAVNDAARKAAGCAVAPSSSESTVDTCAAADIGWMLWGAGSGNNTQAALLTQ